MRSRTQSVIISLISVWVIVFGGVPLLLLLVTSFLEQNSESFYQISFSIQSYYQLLDPAYGEIMLRSLRLAGFTTLACLLIGYPFAWLTCRLEARTRLIVLILMMIPFWTNSLVRTYAIRIVLGTKGLINQCLLFTGLIDSPIRFMYTDSAVIFGLVYLMLPFMVLPIYANLEKFDYRLVEASRDLGAGLISTFCRVIWPLTLPGIVAGCIMVFVPTMGLFYVASLLGGAKNLLIGNLIQQQFLVSRNWPQGAALSVILILMMVLMLLFYGLVLRRFIRRGESI